MSFDAAFCWWAVGGKNWRTSSLTDIGIERVEVFRNRAEARRLQKLKEMAEKTLILTVRIIEKIRIKLIQLLKDTIVSAWVSKVAWEL